MSDSVLEPAAEESTETPEAPVEASTPPVEETTPTEAQTPTETPQEPQKPVAGESWYNNLFGADGKINKENYAKLPDHLKEAAKTLERYDSIEDIFGTLWHQKQALSKGGLAKPDENAPEEVKAAYQEKMRELRGAPEKAEDYDFSRPEDLPEQIQWDENKVKEAQELFHKHGLSADEVADIKNLYVEMEKANYEQTQADYQEKEKAYFKEMGAEAKTLGQDALNTMRTLGFEDEQTHQLVNFAVASGMGPEMVRNLASLKDKISADKFFQGDSQGAVLAGTGGKTYTDLAREAGSKAADAYSAGNKAEGDRFTKEEESYLQMAIKNKELQ